MVREGVDETNDRYQHHSQKQGIHPVVVPVANFGSGRHGVQGHKKDYAVTAAGGGQKKNAPRSRLALDVTRAAYPASWSRHNTTSVTGSGVTCRHNPRQRSSQHSIAIGASASDLILAPRQRMMQNRAIWFRVGASADPRVICKREGLNCFYGKPGAIPRAVLVSSASVSCTCEIPASWQERVRRSGIGLPVRPIFCAELTAYSPQGQRVGRSAGASGAC